MSLLAPSRLSSHAPSLPERRQSSKSYRRHGNWLTPYLPYGNFRCAEFREGCGAACARPWHRLRFADLGKVAIFRLRGTAATYPAKTTYGPAAAICVLALRTRGACHRADAPSTRLAGGIQDSGALCSAGIFARQKSRPCPDRLSIIEPIHGEHAAGASSGMAGNKRGAG